MTGAEIWMNEWHWNTVAFIIALVLSVFHFITNGNRLTRKSYLFFAGILLFLIVTFSPLAFLGHHYLFSAHMVQHILLLLIIPPLLLAGTSPTYLNRLVTRKWFSRTGNVLFRPLIAWIAGIGSMWLWHWPFLFNIMLHSPVVHVLEMISLLVFGTIFIWPVFTPVQWRKLQALQVIPYLFTACVGCTVLGIFITFAPQGLYTSFFHGHDMLVTGIINGMWGITPAIDQQMAGLIMWVPACVVYVTNIMITLARWYFATDEQESGGSSME
jgi:cytochrome c oxidase assembly factor CtaG